MLTTNPRTHILELTKDREIPITENQYQKLKIDQKLANYSDSLEIHDADTGKTLHDWLWRDYLWFREIVRQQNGWDRYVCDFAVRHSMHEVCECKDKYGIFPIQFTEWLNKMFPMRHATTITPSEKNLILSSF